MNANELPTDWDEEKVQRVLAHYEHQTEDDALAEDKAGIQPSDIRLKLPTPRS